jgi:hypothetical protein
LQEFIIMLRGTLSIRSHTGRHGPFKVGILNVGFAHYIVKDPSIEEIDVGSHTGQFEIANTFLKPYPYPGRLIIENRAIVSHFVLDEESDTGSDAVAAAQAVRVEVADVDPADEDTTAPPPPVVTIEEPSISAPAESSAAPLEPAASADQASVLTPTDEELARMKEQSYATLFGPLWPFGDTVKLDTTIDRLRLRQQIKAMNELGYAFQKVGQVYTKKAA